MKNNNLTEIVFILDRSGSMSGLEQDTIGGYNSLLKRQKDEEGEAVVTTVLFDDQYEIVHDHADIKKVRELTEKEYYARGCTALLDAIDEEESKLYVIINEDLVSIPININLFPESGDISVILNREEILFDNPPVIKNDRTLVPFRKIFESLGYTVEWNEEYSLVTAKKDGTVMYLQIGNNEITVNNEKVISDVAPEIINSTTYIPIRIISEQSNFDVEWNDIDGSVIINSVNQ